MGNKLTVLPPKDGGAALARAEALMPIWLIDLDTAPRAALVAVVEAAQQAINTGQPDAIAHALVQPAPPRVIATTMAELVAAFAQDKKNDLSIFMRFLVEDVENLGASAAAITAACTALRRTSTFVPSIAEVLAAVTEHQRGCEGRAGLLRKLPARVAVVRRALEAPP